jgi:hypothetical protein
MSGRDDDSRVQQRGPEGNIEEYVPRDGPLRQAVLALLTDRDALVVNLARADEENDKLREVNDKLQNDLNRQANVTDKAIQALNRNADLGERAEVEATRLRAALNKIAERTGSDDPCRALVQIARDALAAKMALRGFECQDCIGMREHGCYCEAMGAVQPGGPGA